MSKCHVWATVERVGGNKKVCGLVWGTFNFINNPAR